MTNETTASQPKSIGDDAQFQAMTEFMLRSEYDVLVKLIDSFFRALAAQSSATIQAAPEESQWVDRCSYDAQVDEWAIERSNLEAEIELLKSAAPMVADPAGLPTNDEVYAEVCTARDNANLYVSTNAVNDTMAAVRRLMAATVKAVPSEALDTAGWLYGNGFYEVGNPRLTDHIREHGRALFAAPLADKTDGAA